MSDPVSPQPIELIRRAASGDASAWNQLLAIHEPRLRTIVRLRLDPRLAGVVDASDILQNTYRVVAERLPEYATTLRYPFFLWLRMLAGDQLAREHRKYLGTQKRDPTRTLAAMQPMPDASSVNLATFLVGREKAPEEIAVQEERRVKVVQALDQLKVEDREVLVLRHFEQLTALETATTLGITEAAARKRYLRALERFSALLQGLPGGIESIIS